MKKFKNMLRGSFGKNVMMVTVGTAFAQILSIILLPVIAKLYSPGEYGVISVYAAILVGLVGIGISFLGSMNCEKGIPISETDEQAINVLSLSVSTLIFFTIVITFILIKESKTKLVYNFYDLKKIHNLAKEKIEDKYKNI